MTNYHCDWFEVTEPLHSPFNDFIRGTMNAWEKRPVHSHGHQGYQERHEYAGAVVEMWSDFDDRMGRHWRFSGSSWEKVAFATEHEPNWRYWVRKWAQLGRGNITRIDLASDFSDTDARSVAADIMHGMNESLIRKRSWKTIENGELGYTAYFGSRHSDVMLRCYDKGAELDLEPFRLCRTEFEVKKSKGRSIGDGLRTLMVHSNDDEANVGQWLERVTFGLMLDFIPRHRLDSLGVTSWGVQPITLGSWLPKSTYSDTWWWNVVVPALVNRVRQPDGTVDETFWSTFLQQVSDKLKP